MKQENLSNDFDFKNDYGEFSIQKYVQGKRDVPRTSGHARFLYTLLPLELTANGKPFFVPERAAMKILPGTEISVRGEPSSELYSVNLLQNEESFLENLVAKNKNFFDTLEGQDKADWDKVGTQSVNHLVQDEKNIGSIVNESGVLIAPAHSRFKPMVGNGWNLMYMRGSRAMGIGTDCNYALRSNEALHKHNITTEGYICLGGNIQLEVDGEKIELNKDDMLVTVPGEVHAMTGITKFPYKGITLQFPSIPGDKYTPEGVRTR